MGKKVHSISRKEAEALHGELNICHLIAYSDWKPFVKKGYKLIFKLDILIYIVLQGLALVELSRWWCGTTWTCVTILTDWSVLGTGPEQAVIVGASD